MPKRTREDEPAAVATKPLSAAAARRLRAQQQAPPPPTPEVVITVPPKTPQRKPAAQQLHNESAEQERAELRLRRAAIEAKLAERTTIVLAGAAAATGNTVVVRTPERRASGRGPVTTPRGEESALARVKRERLERGEEEDVDGDVEMASAEGSGEEFDIAGAGSSPARIHQISNFTPTAKNCATTDTGMDFRLKRGETLALVGIYQLSVRSGTITVGGVTLTAESTPEIIYAPRTHALPLIEATHTAELTATSHHSGIADVGTLCPTFSGIWAGPPDAPSAGALSFSPIYTSTTPIATLTIPSAWETAITALVAKAASGAPTRVVVAGGPNSGKSTFARLLTNRLLAALPAVAYLDTDPGQPELSPPGILSLHRLTTPLLGPPFTHTVSSALRMHHTGSKSPKEDPSDHVACLTNLAAAAPTDAPLLVNTPGWIKGLGLDLLESTIAAAAATDIVTLDIPRQEAPLAPADCVVHALPAAPAPVAQRRFTGADLRALQTMSYFHRTPAPAGWDFSTPLTGFAPWRVPAEELALAILGERVEREHVAAAVEGTVVALVVMAPAAVPAPVDDDAAPGGLPLVDADELPMPADSRCAGLAVVRALDSARGEVQLLTPVGAAEIDGWEREGLRVVLVRGRVELPVWDMVVPDAPAGGEVPWVGFGGGAMGSGKGNAVWRVRRNVMRRGQQG
ncbi:hypothetical protein EDC01DRAFT_725221 [Geopyxis carbonaria]|nr:hypothetical protein EDC01DRAFT_725221 [Geopyxis carbonaria]